MAAQLDYGYSTPKGIAGGIYDLSDHHIFTRQNEEADGIMGFGVVVVPGSSKGHSSKLPAEGAQREDFEGVVVHQANTEQDMNGKVIIRNGASMGVMRRGFIWAKIAPGCEPVYRKKGYVVVDGDYRGYFTDRTGEYSQYEKCEEGTPEAKKVVSGEAQDQEIKLDSVTPTALGYTPKEGDYVVKKKIHGATVFSGAFFGTVSDVENGIAVVEIE